MKQLNDLLDKLKQLQDGELRLESKSGQRRFYLLDGQLLYSSDDALAVRRFHRAAHCYRPSWKWSVDPYWVSEEKKAWEVRLLERALTRSQLSPIQVKLILRTVLQECFFEVMTDSAVRSEWQDSHLEVSSAYRSSALSVTEVERIWRKTESLHQAWQAGALKYYRLSASPVVSKSVDNQSLPLPAKYFTGDADLWDILQTQTPSLDKLSEQLAPLVAAGQIMFKDVPDLPIPLDDQATEAQLSTSASLMDGAAGTVVSQAGSAAPRAAIANNAKQDGLAPLVACIDDSPVLTQSLKKILTSAGYRTLSIPEPMRGFSKLIEYQPDLILLDLMLPNADGYSVCKFLRDTPVFAKTPIIILTGQDSNLDRLRAKLVGATEFLTKPPKAKALLQLLETHLDPVPAEVLTEESLT